MSKIRYTVRYKGATVEVDVYGDRHRGLAVAEVELPSTAALRRFEPAPWFGREVTGRRAFSNSQLARSDRRSARRRG